MHQVLFSHLSTDMVRHANKRQTSIARGLGMLGIGADSVFSVWQQRIFYGVHPSLEALLDLVVNGFGCGIGV